MSMANQITAAIHKRMDVRRRWIEQLPFNERITAYLKIVRRNEHRKADIGAAVCDCARASIMRIYCVSFGVESLPIVLLTPEERARCYAENIDAKRLAFDRLLVNLGAPSIWEKRPRKLR